MDRGPRRDRQRDAFVALEDKRVLFGPDGATLRKILARGKPLELSPELKDAVKDADFTKTATLVFDLNALAKDARLANEIKRRLRALYGNAINSEFLKKLDGLSCEASLKGPNVVVRASLTTKDAQTAGEVKNFLEAGQVVLRGTIQPSPRMLQGGP